MLYELSSSDDFYANRFYRTRRVFNSLYQYNSIENLKTYCLLRELHAQHNSSGINKYTIKEFIESLGLEYGLADSPLMVIHGVLSSLVRKSNVFYNKNFNTELLKISFFNSESNSPLISFGNIDLENKTESLSLNYYGLPNMDMENNLFIRQGNIVNNVLVMQKEEGGNKGFFMAMATENCSKHNFSNKKDMENFLKNIKNLKQNSNPYDMFKNVNNISIPLVMEFKDGCYKYKAQLLS